MSFPRSPDNSAIAICMQATTANSTYSEGYAVSSCDTPTYGIYSKESNNVNEDLMSKQKAKMSTTAYKKAIEQLGLTQEGAGDVVGLSPRQAQRVVGGHARPSLAPTR